MPQNKKPRKGTANSHARRHTAQASHLDDDTLRELSAGEEALLAPVPVPTESSVEDKPALAEWKRAYEAAVRFRDMAPWAWLEEDQMFAVANPEDGEVGYCSVLGSLGEFHALVVYRGEEGLLRHERILRHVTELEELGRNPADDPEPFLDQKSLMVSFEGSSEVDKRDRQVYQSLGLKFRGKSAWPILRSVEPGCPPWFLTGPECRFVAYALEQAVEVAARVQADPNLLDTKPGCILTRTPAEGGMGSDLEWADEWPAWPYLEAGLDEDAYPRVEVDEMRLKRAVRAGKRSGTWEVDIAYAPFIVQEGPRPSYPRLLLCVDDGSGMVLTIHAADRGTDGAEFVEALVAAMEQHKLIPEAIIVCRKQVAQLLLPLAHGLASDVLEAPVLPGLEEARASMREYMGRR